jgi:hypothetical protein
VSALLQHALPYARLDLARSQRTLADLSFFPLPSSARHSSRPTQRPIGPDPDLVEHLVQYNDWVAWFRAKHSDKVSLNLFLWPQRERREKEREAHLDLVLPILVRVSGRAGRLGGSKAQRQDQAQEDLGTVRTLQEEIPLETGLSTVVASLTRSELSLASLTSADPISFSLLF